jgi:5-methylcytosine-specific restriction protein A
MPYNAPRHRAPWVRSRESYVAERKARADASRPPSSKRGYDGEWRKLRARFLAEFPNCAACSQPATDVDHVADVRRYPHLRLTWSNLRSLCHSCHSRHTATTQGFARRSR